MSRDSTVFDFAPRPASAYGWSDLDLRHGFHATKQGEGYTLSEPARRTVLDRLLQLNHQRYAEEVAAGVHVKKKGKPTKAALLPTKSDHPKQLRLFFETIGTKSSSRMKFRLIDSGWRTEFERAAALEAEDLLIMTPFIKRTAAERLTHGKNRIRLLTRFDLNLMRDGTCDLSALRALVRQGASVRGIQNLHSKMYIFGRKRAIVTSANLTEAGASRNHELGFCTDDRELVDECRSYFERLWKQAGKSVVAQTLVAWGRQIDRLPAPAGSKVAGLPDFGAKVGFTARTPTQPASKENRPAPGRQQAFVKFFGVAANRARRDSRIIDLVGGVGSNWALPYPKNRRPKSVQDGDRMFISHLANDGDTLIYGRAIAYAYRPKRDDASAADMKAISWKRKWSRYIRVHTPEFVSGTLGNGVSLKELMEKFGADAFESTRRHKREGRGNVSPQKALMRKAGVRLSRRAAHWLEARLDEAFATHGKLSKVSLKLLQWPRIPEL